MRSRPELVRPVSPRVCTSPLARRHEGCCPCQNTCRLLCSLVPVLPRRSHQSNPIRAQWARQTHRQGDFRARQKACALVSTICKSMSEHSSVYCLLFVCSSFKRSVRIQAGEGFLRGDGPSRPHSSFFFCLHPFLFQSKLQTFPHHPFCFYLLSNFASPLTYFFLFHLIQLHFHFIYLSPSSLSLSSSLSPSPPPLSFPQRSDRSLS